MTFRTHLSVALAGAFFLPICAKAEISATGSSTDPVADDSFWSSGGDLVHIVYIGDSSIGSLSINQGSDFLSYQSYIGHKTGSNGTATVDGAGSTWASSELLFVGYSGGTATLDVSDGAAVSNSSGYIGDGTGSNGAVTVDGAGSTWTNSGDLYVGGSGTGTLNVSNGAAVSNSDGYIGSGTGSGTFTVDGAGSTWTSSGKLTVGSSAGGTGTLNVSNGAAVVSGSSTVDISSGAVTVDGAGSTLTVGRDLQVGRYDTGTLTVSNGAAVSSSRNIEVGRSSTGTLNVSSGAVLSTDGDIIVYSTSKVNLYVAGNGMLKAGADGGGGFTNNGTVNLFAYASLAAGTYNPITVGSSSGSFAGSGSYNAFGGTWTGSQFVVNAVAAGSSLTDPQLLSEARLSYNDSQLVVAFDQGAGTTNFNVTELTPGTIGGEAVSGAYDFSTGLSGSDVLLSFDIGTGHALEDISIWHLADGEGEIWTLFNPDSLSYAGEWLNFTVGSFSSYAVTVVPEPATYSLLLGLVACGSLFRRRRS